MSDKLIEKIYADKFDTDLTSRKDIGDIYVNKIPINIKSSRVGGNNFSPNLVSADKLYNHLIDEKNNLFKLEVKSQFLVNDIKGVKQSAYDKISKSLDIQGNYRTYDYSIAKRSSVYLEPIQVAKGINMIEDNKPKQPEPPAQPEKPKGGINED